MGKGRILSRWRYYSSLDCASKPSDLKAFAAGMGVIPWVQRGHPTFKFRQELKYLALAYHLYQGSPCQSDGLNGVTQSAGDIKFSVRLHTDKAIETGRWTGVKCIWASEEQPQLLMASAVISRLYMIRWEEQRI